MLQPLKRVRITKRHVRRAFFWVGVSLIVTDAASALGIVALADHLSHLTGATGATFTAFADAAEQAAKAEL